jgi:Ca2+-binding EF-hand superfamily protein
MSGQASQTPSQAQQTQDGDAPQRRAQFDKLANHVRRPLNEMFFKWLSLEQSELFIRSQIQRIVTSRDGGTGIFTPSGELDPLVVSDVSPPSRSPTRNSSYQVQQPLSPSRSPTLNMRLPVSPKMQGKIQGKQFHTNSPPRSPNMRSMRSLDLDGHSAAGPSRRTQLLHRKLQSQLAPDSSTRLRVKPFYFPQGSPLCGKTRNMLLDAIKDTFTSTELHNGTHGLSLHEFFPITLRVCELPSYCNSALFMAVLEFAQRSKIFPTNDDRNKQGSSQNLSKRMAALNRKMVDNGGPGSSSSSPQLHSPSTTDASRSNASPSLSISSATSSPDSPSAEEKDGWMLSGNPVVSMADFLRYWEHNIARYNVHQRLFRILKKDNKRTRWLEREDFEIIVQEIVARHPGLEFLEATPEFQEHYIVTVIARIFYQINTSGNDRITLSEFSRSNFLAKLSELDKEDDVNKIYDYFSYEHFYVIYCKFWELDTDHDNLLDITDLIRYEDYALSSRAVRRVVDGYARPLRSKIPNKLCYEDFVVFLISDIDKDSRVSLDYWFKAIDLDGDGLISYYELEHFVVEQRQRMQSISQEEVLIPDMICQLMDIVHPANSTHITKTDIANSKSCSLFFNMLLNLNRHMLHEQRDPMRIKRIHDTAEVFSSWDRYVICNYMALAEVEAEGYEYGYQYGGGFEDGSDGLLEESVNGQEEYDAAQAADMRAEQLGQMENWMEMQQREAKDALESGDAHFQLELIDQQQVDGVATEGVEPQQQQPQPQRSPKGKNERPRSRSMQDGESDEETWSPSLLEQIAQPSAQSSVQQQAIQAENEHK